MTAAQSAHAAGRTTYYAVFVDGVRKGEVRRHKGRWLWQRGEIATETFARSATLDDVAEWARKCCNGKAAKVHTVRIRA